MCLLPSLFLGFSLSYLSRSLSLSLASSCGNHREKRPPRPMGQQEDAYQDGEGVRMARYSQKKAVTSLLLIFHCIQ